MQKRVTLRTEEEFQSALWVWVLPSNLYYLRAVWIRVDDYAQAECSIKPGLCCFPSLDVIPRCG